MSSQATGLPGQRRSASVPVSGSVSESDHRGAACVGGFRERVRPAAPEPPSPHAFRLPRAPHELAHALALATRDPLAGLAGGPEFPGQPQLPRLLV
jgi:hypothetical protein